MNCKEFESTLNDIARGAAADTDARAAREAHAAECQPCAALLSDARSLTAGLRALSAETAGASAPPRVESNLLAAFRAQKAAAVTAPAVVAGLDERARRPAAEGPTAAATTAPSAPVVIPFAAKRWSWPKTFAAAGMAAAAAVAFVLLVPQMFSGPRTDPATLQAETQRPSKTNSGLPPQAKIIVPPEVNVAAAAEQDGPAEPRRAPSVVANAPRVNRGGGVTMASVKYGGGGVTRNNVARPSAQPAAAAERREITTDFIPLAQGGGFVAGEGGHVVRVELPRTALAQFGLPVNADRPDGRVKADVLLGEDGMARAIRFVR